MKTQICKALIVLGCLSLSSCTPEQKPRLYLKCWQITASGKGDGPVIFSGRVKGAVGMAAGQGVAVLTFTDEAGDAPMNFDLRGKVCAVAAIGE